MTRILFSILSETDDDDDDDGDDDDDDDDEMCPESLHKDLELQTNCQPYCITQCSEFPGQTPEQISNALSQRRLEINKRLVKLLGLLGTNTRRLKILFREKGESMNMLFRTLYENLGLSAPHLAAGM